MIVKGVVLALSCAVNMSVIDALRKYASKQRELTSTALVCVVAILDAVISCSIAYINGGFVDVRFQDPHTFIIAVLASAALLLFSKFLYQHAVSTSSLSLTIPYLSFTAIFLVGTAYLFVGEEISRLGLIGICVITAAGYLLSQQAAPGGSSSSSSPVSTATSKQLPSLHGAAGGLRSHSRSKSWLSLHGAWSSMDPGHKAGSRPDHHALVMPAGADLRRHHDQDDEANALVKRNSHGASTKYDKQEPPLDSLPSFGTHVSPFHVAVWGGHSLGSSTAVALTGSTTHTIAARSVHRNTLVTQATHDLEFPELGSTPGTPTAIGAGLSDRPGSHMLHAQGTASSLGLAPGGLSMGREGSLKQAASSRWESGSAMMVCVAAIWSCTAALDKLGVLHSPNVWVYFSLQRLVIGCASVVYLAMHAPHTFRLLVSRHLRLLLVISFCEMLSVVLFLEAIRYLFVSYVIALKRSNILLSVLAGGLLFNEPIKHRLPYVMLMLLGMCIIVLDPDASSVHTSSHA